MSTGRLAKFRPGELSEGQDALYRSIAGGPRAQGTQLFRLLDDEGGLEGPFNAFLLQPALGDALQSLGAAVRYRTGLSDRARELAILVVAAVWDSGFERYAHEAVGRAAGLTDVELDAVRRGAAAEVESLSPHERQVVRCALSLSADGDLDDDEYAAAIADLGVEAVFELTTLVGYYATLALQLRVFRVAAPNASTP